MSQIDKFTYIPLIVWFMVYLLCLYSLYFSFFVTYFIYAFNIRSLLFVSIIITTIYYNFSSYFIQIIYKSCLKQNLLLINNLIKFALFSNLIWLCLIYFK